MLTLRASERERKTGIETEISRSAEKKTRVETLHSGSMVPIENVLYTESIILDAMLLCLSVYRHSLPKIK
jgi:hypothetical protein